jgi:hypothetical protein
MSKHHKHKHHHHEKEHNAPAKGAEQSITAKPSNEAAAAEKGADEEGTSEGVFENIAELDTSKSGGHAPVPFIAPHVGNDLSAQASLAAHAAADEDKDPADVPQELSHKEILNGAAGEPSAPKDVTDSLPGEGQNPDAQVPTQTDPKKDGEADAGQATNGANTDASTPSSTDGSAKATTDLAAPSDVAADVPVTDSSVPSAS